MHNPPPRFNSFRAEGAPKLEGRVCAAPHGWGRGSCPPWLGTILLTAVGLWGRRIPNTLPISLPLAYPGAGVWWGVRHGWPGGFGGVSPSPCALQALLKTGENSWSLAELVQALVLLTHYHSLASFVFGCGINPEEEQDGGHSCQPPSPHSDSSPASDDSMGGSGVRGGGGLCLWGCRVGRAGMVGCWTAFWGFPWELLQGFLLGTADALGLHRSIPCRASLSAQFLG